MANVTVAGASYTDVPAVELPTTGGGTSTFYEVSGGFKTVTQTLTNISSSADDTRVEAGNSFYTELTPADGYYISSITVTMGGVDITDQVFKPGLGAKTITTNGTYAASSDSLSGYSAVAVNVPNSYAAGDEGKVVSNGALVAQGSDTVTQNGTVDTTLISSLTVSVSGGGSPTLQSKTKTYTPTTSTQTETVSADPGYDGLSSVDITVNPIPSGYVQFSAFPSSVIVKNGKSSTISVVRIQYDADVIMRMPGQANITSGSTATYSNLLTDGTHIWLRATNCTTVKYNGATATFTVTSNSFMITIPSGFDNTIPFVLS